MTIRNLYRYQRPDGGYDVSPNQPPEGTEYTLRYRLIADKGMAITDGTTIITGCVDVATPIGWTDCLPPSPPEDENTQE